MSNDEKQVRAWAIAITRYAIWRDKTTRAQRRASGRPIPAKHPKFVEFACGPLGKEVLRLVCEFAAVAEQHKMTFDELLTHDWAGRKAERELIIIERRASLYAKDNP